MSGSLPMATDSASGCFFFSVVTRERGERRCARFFVHLRGPQRNFLPSCP